jgi:hypothetical protein
LTVERALEPDSSRDINETVTHTEDCQEKTIRSSQCDKKGLKIGEGGYFYGEEDI